MIKYRESHQKCKILAAVFAAEFNTLSSPLEFGLLFYTKNEADCKRNNGRVSIFAIKISTGNGRLENSFKADMSVMFDDCCSTPMGCLITKDHCNCLYLYCVALWQESQF